MSATISVRPYTIADVPQLVRIQSECFPPPFPEELLWQPQQIASHIVHFPEGALCACLGDELVGSATSTRLHFSPEHPDHSWAEVADEGWIRTCDPTGDTLYGIDIAVRPSMRGHGVARALYQARFALVRRLGLVRFLAGSRLSGYHHYRYLTPEAYASEVVAGVLRDPVITPQLKAGLRPLQPLHVVHDYLTDADSSDCALLMEWLPDVN